MEALAVELIGAMCRGDTAAVTALLSADLAVVFGVVDGIVWPSFEEAAAGLAARFEGGWRLDVRPGCPRAFRQGEIAWFADRPVMATAGGGSVVGRLSGVARLEEGQWRLLQWHASLGLSNEYLDGALPPRHRVRRGIFPSRGRA